MIGVVNNEFKRGLHQTIWTQIQDIEDFSKQKLLKFAKFLSELLNFGAIDFRLFKYLDVDQIDKKVLQISILVLKNYLSYANSERIKLECQKCSSKRENMDVCQNLKRVATIVEGSKEKYLKKIETEKEKQSFLSNLTLFKRQIKYKPTESDFMQE